MLKRTPLHEFHVALGAKMVDFAGWEMPILYRGIVEEHEQSRRSGSLFDVSHMGRLHFTGKDAGTFLNKVVTRNVAEQKVAGKHATPMFEQILQQQELLRGELYLVPFVRHDVTLQIERNGTESQHGASRLRLPRAARDRADAGDQLVRTERLGHVVVSPQLKTPDPVALISPRSDHDYWNPGRLAVRA